MGDDPSTPRLQQKASDLSSGSIKHVNFTAEPTIRNIPGSDDQMNDYVATSDVSISSLEARMMPKDQPEVPVTTENCIRTLECASQSYAWGKVGSDALVARLKKGGSPEFVVDESSTYAELWLGTHPNGMSKVIVPNLGDGSSTLVPLVDYVRSNPQLHCGVVGEPDIECDLTFLFKILSIKKVLSIQAHPDKVLAEQLHADRPKVYKDPNHKPEMAVALSDDFQALCGFRPLEEIAAHLRRFPEFQNVVGFEMTDHLFEAAKAHMEHHPPRKVLKHFFQAYMEANVEETVLPNLNKMLERLQALPNPDALESLILKLSVQFPGDAGIFAPLIFNHVKLQKGQAFFMGANEPHAYIQGDIMECMACSDNVVRAGLTPKLKDVETLVQMLTYKCQMPEVTSGVLKDDNCRLYAPPVDDFAMEVISIPAGERYILKPVASPSVLLILEGQGHLEQGSDISWDASFGRSAFMSANTSATVIASADLELKLVRALSNVHL